jgi:hypothetical protein
MPALLEYLLDCEIEEEDIYMNIIQNENNHDVFLVDCAHTRL